MVVFTMELGLFGMGKVGLTMEETLTKVKNIGIDGTSHNSKILNFMFYRCLHIASVRPYKFG